MAEHYLAAMHTVGEANARLVAERDAWRELANALRDRDEVYALGRFDEEAKRLSERLRKARAAVEPFERGAVK